MKELPDSKVGDEYVWVEHLGFKDRGAYYLNGDTDNSYWTKEYVENNLAWFKPKEEEVKVVVGKMSCVESSKPVGELKWDLNFKVNKHIHYDNAVDTCKLLEKHFNNELPKAEPTPTNVKEEKLFKVNEKVNIPVAVWDDEKKLVVTKKIEGVLNSANYWRNYFEVEFFNPEDGQPKKRIFGIGQIEKIPTQPKEEKPVLFITEDGQPAYIGCRYWLLCVLSEDWPINETIMRQELATPPSYFKYFSTKEAAETYVLNNKPCLSINDIKEACDANKFYNRQALINFLTKKIKQ